MVKILIFEKKRSLQEKAPSIDVVSFEAHSNKITTKNTPFMLFAIKKCTYKNKNQEILGSAPNLCRSTRTMREKNRGGDVALEVCISPERAVV